ncbi:hypothetical protein BH18THE2_BH18THE2_28130 [soil metagenome]
MSLCFLIQIYVVILNYVKNMNQKTIAIAAVLATTMLTGIFATTPMAAYAGGDYGDSSETSTEQEIKQKNVGSGSSTNLNCGDNDIEGETELDLQLCGTLDISALG